MSVSEIRTRRQPIRSLIWKVILLFPPGTRLLLWRALVLLPRPMRQSIWQVLVRRDREINPLSLTSTAPKPPPTGLAALRQPSPRSGDVITWLGDGNATARAVLFDVAVGLARRGNRAFLLVPSPDSAVVGEPRLIEERVFELPVSAHGPDPNTIQLLGDRLRYDYGVVDAVFFHDPAEARDVITSFTKRFGWKDQLVAPPVPTGESPESQSSPAASIAIDFDVLYPRASIVVVTYNNLAYNRLCLESIYSKTAYPNVEVIVVDNQSTDGTRDFLVDFQKSHASCKVILSETNEGFARANNRGAALATGAYVVFLNNDTVVTRPWLSHLIQALDDPAIGVVGPLSSRRGDESGIATGYATLGDLDDFVEGYTRPREGRRFEATRIIFFCAAMRRSVFDEIGNLDERFGMGMFEDDDYTERVKRAGYRVVYLEDTFVHHWGNASFSRLDVAEYLRLIDTNRRQFEKKWGVKWNPRPQKRP